LIKDVVEEDVAWKSVHIELLFLDFRVYNLTNGYYCALIKLRLLTRVFLK